MFHNDPGPFVSSRNVQNPTPTSLRNVRMRLSKEGEATVAGEALMGTSLVTL